jgi:murein DD-endopeptidase MepM/ murein hydrolase activator NlpD
VRSVRRWYRVVTVIVILCGPVTVGFRPAAAADVRHQRDLVRQQEADVKVQINLAVASDDQVEAEAARLARAVTAEQAAEADAQSAVRAADVQVTQSQARLDDIDRRVAATHKALVDRAVELYKHPFQTQQLLLNGVDDMNQYAERQALISVAVEGSVDVIDVYRAQHLDEQAARRQLDRSRAEAVARRSSLAAQAARLTTAQQAAGRAHSALQARIADLEFETQGLAQQEAKLQAQLAAQEAALARQQGGFVFNGPQAGLIWPVQGPVTQEFGNHLGGFHPGIDIAPPFGTPIHAPGDGVVIFAGWESGYGNYTCISHGRGISTCFGHQSHIGVHVGQRVHQGDVIGLEGSTGHSTGPHVHFEVRVNNVVTNPRNYVAGNP